MERGDVEGLTDAVTVTVDVTILVPSQTSSSSPGVGLLPFESWVLLAEADEALGP